MRIGWVIVGLALCSPLGATPSDAWTDTDLNLALAKVFISNEKCASDPQYLLSCINAIHAAASMTGQALPDDAESDFERTLAVLSENHSPAVLGKAINAHLQTFDAHASLEPTHRDQSESYMGVGLSMHRSPHGLLVDSVFQGSPAEQAGLEYGDIVQTISESSAGLVDLAVLRDAGLTKILLPRIKIQMPNLATELMPDGVLYVRLRSFTRGSCFALRDEFLNAKKVLLDLRGNAGGDLSEAVCLVSTFAGMKNVVGTKFTGIAIPETNLVHVFDKSGDIHWLSGYFIRSLNIPLVVLVDAGTASAAEVAAGGLMYHRKALLVGERTYGKGSVQAIAPLAGHPSLTLAATTARYYLPNRATTQRLGIQPSFVVPYKLNATDEERIAPREADEYPTGLNAEGEPWEDPRQNEITKLTACATQQAPVGRDFQRAWALAVLKCIAP